MKWETCLIFRFLRLTHVGKFFGDYILEYFRQKTRVHDNYSCELESRLEHCGYLNIGGEQANTEKLVKWLNDNFDAETIAAGSKTSGKIKSGILDQLDLSMNGNLRDLVMDVLNGSGVASIARRYFREDFVVNQAALWLSPGVKIEHSSSQMYHFDREAWRQLKLFIPLTSIDDHTGKFVFLDKKDTRKFLKNAWLRIRFPSLKQRFGDDQIKNLDVKEKHPDLEVGEVFLIDTTNCLHYGSRPAEKPSIRLMVHLLPRSCERVGRFLAREKGILWKEV